MFIRAIVTTLFTVGCVEVDRSARFIPSLDVSESAIKKGMEEWLHGHPSGTIPGTKPVVIVVDSFRKPTQELSHYEILGEVAGNAPRCFAVLARLKNKANAAEKLVRIKYIVVGIDPLWVFRQEDYDMLSHWEHAMEETEEVETTEK